MDNSKLVGKFLTGLKILSWFEKFKPMVKSEPQHMSYKTRNNSISSTYNNDIITIIYPGSPLTRSDFQWGPETFSL